MKYGNLTNLIDKFKNDNYGEWAKQPKEADGSKEHPYIMPYVMYSKDVHILIEEVYKVAENHPEFNMYQYKTECEKLKLCCEDDMLNADTSKQDIKTCFLQLMYILKADRFCEGTILRCLKKGLIQKILIRIKKLDK